MTPLGEKIVAPVFGCVDKPPTFAAAFGKTFFEAPRSGRVVVVREAGLVKVFFTVLVGEEERVLLLPPLPQNTPVRLNAEALND